jgi:hypothetical protein
VAIPSVQCDALRAFKEFANATITNGTAAIVQRQNA